jgi:hypothetical protein
LIKLSIASTIGSAQEATRLLVDEPAPFSGVLLPDSAFFEIERELRVADQLRSLVALSDSTIDRYRTLYKAEQALRLEYAEIAREALDVAEPSLLEQIFDTGTLAAVAILATVALFAGGN